MEDRGGGEGGGRGGGGGYIPQFGMSWCGFYSLEVTGR